MKVELVDINRAFEVLRGLVKERDCRCAGCAALLEPKGESFLPIGPRRSVRIKPATLYLECPGCHKRYALPADVDKEATRRMAAHKRQADAQTPNTCPECGTRMVPEGRCLVCHACGHSRCG